MRSDCVRTGAIAIALAITPFLIGCGAANGTSSALKGGGSTPENPQPVPDFSISVTQPSVTVFQGSPAVYTVSLKAINGFSAPVAFSIGGLPAGASGAVAPAQITPTAAGAPGTMTIQTTGSGESTTPAGQSTITVTASGGGATHKQTTVLVVQQPGSLAGQID